MLLAQTKQNWFPVALSRDVQNESVSRKLQSVPILLVRDEKGRVHAYEDACPHRGFPLSRVKIKEKSIQCGYHGYQFNLEGECTNIPALKENSCRIKKSMGLREFGLTEKLGMIFVRLDPPADSSGEPFVPQLIDDSSVVCFDFGIIHCNYLNLIDNFMDSVHPAFVHPFLLSGKKKNAVTITVENKLDCVEATYRPDGKVAKPGVFGLLLSGDEQKNPVHIERFFLPCVHQIEHETSNSLYVATQYCVPVDENHTRIFFHLQIRSPFPKWLIAPIVKVAVYFLVKQDQTVLEILEKNLEKLPYFKPKSTVLDAIGLRVKQLMEAPAINTAALERAAIEIKAEL
jgi:phenylpropionate dioxygenase-like ring-hydroxylating dioxygenase large terminal subunit